MTRDREILVIGTYGIDVFYGIVEQMELNGYIAFTCSSPVIAREYLNNRRFDAIIINLEPDGKGGVAEIDLLDTIANAAKHQGGQASEDSGWLAHFAGGAKNSRRTYYQAARGARPANRIHTQTGVNLIGSFVVLLTPNPGASTLVCYSRGHNNNYA
jgi:hypothetical protein